MGYRSSIRLALAKEIVEGANLLELAFPKMIQEADDIDVQETRVIYYWEDVKFYDDFPEVAELRKFMDELDTGESPFAAFVEGDSQDFYQFARMGEEYGDYETQGDLWTFYADQEITVD